MIKGILFLAAVAVAAGVLTGVLEVTVHSDRLARAPTRLLTIFKEQSLWEQIRAHALRGKRFTEQKLIEDEKRQLELALLYTKSDAERLQELLEESEANPQKLFPQAELLASSLARAQAIGENASADTLVALKDKTQETYAQVKKALTTLQSQEDKYEELRSKFTNITETLQKHLNNTQGGETEFEATEESTATPKPSPIPLKF